jgi:hypothetical protein
MVIRVPPAIGPNDGAIPNIFGESAEPAKRKICII